MKLTLKKGIIIQKLGNSFIAYDNATGMMHEFNETGYAILEGIEKGKGRGKIVKNITKLFSVSEKETAEDFETFVKLLIKKKIVVGGRSKSR